MSQAKNDGALIGILQLAYSGELAAAYAYRGHWKSLSDPEERHRIEEIETKSGTIAGSSARCLVV